MSDIPEIATLEQLAGTTCKCGKQALVARDMLSTRYCPACKVTWLPPSRTVIYLLNEILQLRKLLKQGTEVDADQVKEIEKRDRAIERLKEGISAAQSEIGVFCSNQSMVGEKMNKAWNHNAHALNDIKRILSE